MAVVEADSTTQLQVITLLACLFGGIRGTGLCGTYVFVCVGGSVVRLVVVALLTGVTSSSNSCRRHSCYMPERVVLE
jgi:hypothetical protein